METGAGLLEEDADSVLASFRNDYNQRIAVTVDMIATGTDVKPLEVLLFMRDVRSKGYYEQMKGRGVRSLDGDSLKRVSNSADGAKTRFVLIDAVGVEKSLKTESRPLEKKPTVALKDLLQGIALGHRDDDTVLSLVNRLVRLNKQLDDKAKARIEKVSGGVSAGHAHQLKKIQAKFLHFAHDSGKHSFRAKPGSRDGDFFKGSPGIAVRFKRQSR